MTTKSEPASARTSAYCVLSPSNGLALILPLEPGDERLEVIDDSGGVELPLTGRIGKNVLPRPALPCRQHASQLLSCGFVAIHRAAVERASPSRRAAPRAMELELQDASQKVPHIGHVGRNVILGTGIEVLLSPSDRLDNSLVAMLQVPPCCIVVPRCNLPRKNAPAPTVERERERQKRDLVERDPE